MTQLTLHPLRRTVDIPSGSNLLEAIRGSGIEISSPCDGKQLCGKCKLHIKDPDPLPGEIHPHLTRRESAQGIRLACETIINKNTEVTLPDDRALDSRILEGELIKNSRIEPAAKVVKIDDMFHLLYHNRSPVSLEDSWETKFSPKGLAIDLGTTTIVITLIDLQSGDELATVSAVNPQTRFGHDVMTRIQKASTHNGLQELTTLISNGLNALIEKACKASGTFSQEIVDVVIGGNTTMLQIAASIDPAPLGEIPFSIGIQGDTTYPAAQFLLKIHPQARVYIPPVAHAFVGSDISAGLLSIDMFHYKKPVLFVDLGTNGEVALFANGQLSITSTAAGPAFEGMGITHGMTAARGAIEMVWSNEKHINLRTIGNVEPVGICGSGIVDIMACFLEMGIVDAGGLLKAPQSGSRHASFLTERYEILDGFAAIRLADHVYFTQKDVRQFQLAKSAIQTGIEMLLSAAGVAPAQLEKIFIAGGFGYYLKTDRMRQTGIIPRDYEDEIHFSGNTSRTGCVLLLLDTENRDYLGHHMKQAHHLSTAESPDFQTLFIKNISMAL